MNFIERKITRNVTLTEDDEKNLKKLRKEHNSKHIHRYRKFTRLIDNASIVWPSEKLALYGAKQMINNKKRWKSADIPNLMTDLLTYDLDTQSKDNFHTLRDDRNKIAHGKRLSYTLDKALLGNEFLYNLAKKLDEHVVKNFMIIEKYR